MTEKIYLNGKIINRENASIDIEDRGYQFADGVYEVVAFYQGEPFTLKEHMERLVFSASEIDIEIPPADILIKEAKDYLAETDFADKNAKLYIQVSRGAAPRSHAYPDEMEPIIIMKAGPLNPNPEKYFEEGVKIITLPDERWSRCYIKSIALLPNILAKKKAKKSGAYEAVMTRDGFITEGSSSNIFIVEDDTIITPPATNYILNGITRQTVINKLAPKLGFKVNEESIPYYTLLNSNQVFLTGTTTEIMPVVQINDKVVGNGKVGAETKAIFEAFRELTGFVRGK
ncbi:MAG: D-amino-acid transaminase [Halanaerobium sp.]